MRRSTGHDEQPLIAGGGAGRFDTRAIENIASAPATPFDRRAAITLSVVLVVAFGLTIPISRAPWPAAPAFLPLVIGASVLALILTAVLLYVQYRIERDTKLAFLGLGYAWLACAQTLYILTFPGIFAPRGFLGGAQTASGFFISSQLAFGAFLILHGIASRAGWRFSGRRVRYIGFGATALFAALALWFTAGHQYLPAVASLNGSFNPFLAYVAAPAMIGVMAIGVFVVSERLQTVSQVWITAVLFSRFLALITSGQLAGARYSFGWYAARIEDLVGAIVILAVFLVKINDLLLRLAARNRSTTEALAVGEARYASLANVVPQLIWTTDANGAVEYVNDRWVAYTGYDLNDTRDDGWRTALHPDHAADGEAWRDSLRSGEPFAAEQRLREGATGRYHWFLVNAVPARGKRAEIVAWVGTCTDIDAQKRAEEREAFIARAGERLGASLDVSATVAAMKDLLIPRLCERSWVALLDDDGRYVVAGVGSTDLGDELDARRSVGVPLAPALHEAVAAIVATGAPVVLSEPDRFPDAWVRDRPAGAAMVIPLIDGEVTIGVLVLVRSGGRAYDEDDASLVREFARRAALSLEHARLYERERSTANMLQLAMLPASLPQLPDVKFSASYSAASETQRVGGDFYDAFELPDGRVAVTIGDVTGHGLEAAVIMGEIRQALRAASFEAIEPSAILDRASRLLVASGRTVFVTAIFGVLDTVTGRFAYATAGHPPPLVYEGAALRRLQAAGLPIGLRDDEGVDFALRLDAPCTLVMFTDGLLEFSRDIDAAEARIESAIRSLANEEIDHLAGALMQEVLGDDAPTDDIAILTMTIDRFAGRPAGDAREWRFASDDGRTGGMVRREVGELIGRWTRRHDARFGSELAFGELVANAVRHAPGPVRVVASTDGADAAATLVVEDSGHGFAPSAGALDPYAETGRGLGLVRTVSDGVTIQPASRGGTRVTVTFHSEVRALATAT